MNIIESIKLSLSVGITFIFLSACIGFGLAVGINAGKRHSKWLFKKKW